MTGSRICPLPTLVAVWAALGERPAAGGARPGAPSRVAHRFVWGAARAAHFVRFLTDYVDPKRKNSHRRCAAAGGGSSGHRSCPGVPAAWPGCGCPSREGRQRSLGCRRVRRLGQDHRQGDPLVRVAGSIVLSWPASRVDNGRPGSGLGPAAIGIRLDTGATAVKHRPTVGLCIRRGVSCRGR